MESTHFDKPVFVKDGKHLVREITCIYDALEFLTDWPKARRGSIYETAARACQAARDGRMSIEGARSALIGFARSAGILEQAPVHMEPWMIAPKTGRGGVPI
jgi:hypothetical protein